MLVIYKYRSGSGVFGWFQCDISELDSFFETRENDIFWLVWKPIDQEKCFVWSAATRRWSKRKECPWWCPAPKAKSPDQGSISLF